eukprot:gene17963-5669_t
MTLETPPYLQGSSLRTTGAKALHSPRASSLSKSKTDAPRLDVHQTLYQPTLRNQTPA